MLGVAALVSCFVLGRYIALKVELPAHMARVERVSMAIILGGQAKMASLHASLYQNVRAGNFEYVKSTLCKLIKADADLLSGFELPAGSVEHVLASMNESHVAGALERIRESDCAQNYTESDGSESKDR